MDTRRPNRIALPLAHRRPLRAAPRRRPHTTPPRAPHEGVRARAARVAERGCAAARWWRWVGLRHRCVYDARTVYVRVPVRHGGAEYRAWRLGRIYCVGAVAGSRNDGAEWEWRACGGLGGRCA